MFMWRQFREYTKHEMEGGCVAKRVKLKGLLKASVTICTFIVQSIASGARTWRLLKIYPHTIERKIDVGRTGIGIYVGARETTQVRGDGFEHGGCARRSSFDPIVPRRNALPGNLCSGRIFCHRQDSEPGERVGGVGPRAPFGVIAYPIRIIVSQII